MKKKIINSELCSFFLSLSSLRRLDSILDLLNLLLNGRQDGVLLRSLVHENSGDLDGADNAEEEVYGSQKVVLGRDDQAPAGPDEARCRQGGVLGQRQLLCWSEEVGYTGKDDGPLHDGSPEMHRLDTDGAVPQALEEARVGLSLRSGAALPPPAGMLLPLLLTEGGASLGGDLAGSEDGASRRAHKGCCCCRHFFLSSVVFSLSEKLSGELVFVRWSYFNW